MMVRRRVQRRAAGAAAQAVEDQLAVEEPLEIRVAGRPYVVTMRTPGHDIQLALGLLYAEGIITHHDDFSQGIFCAGDGAPNTYNVLDVTLAPHLPHPAEQQRSTVMTSACGVCGSTSIEQVRKSSRFDLASYPATIPATALTAFPQALRSAQQTFERTGGLHAAALFNAVDGSLLVAREDVGRHNAVDKVIGWALQQEQLPLAETVLMVSGRASFELVQKAVLAGIPIMAAVSAPSSLAVDLAREAGLTLVGFLRGDAMVVYSRDDRIR